jgi:two-component system nitrogen regulation response regulator GlnG
MQHYAWPGNVRELENLMRRLAALTRGEYIFASAVEEGLRDGQPLRTALISDSVDSLSGAVEAHIARYFSVFGDDLPPDGLYERILAEIERPLLLLTLAATHGNQIQAAKLLGINRNTLRKKLTLRDINPGALRLR